MHALQWSLINPKSACTDLMEHFIISNILRKYPQNQGDLEYRGIGSELGILISEGSTVLLLSYIPTANITSNIAISTASKGECLL